SGRTWRGTRNFPQSSKSSPQHCRSATPPTRPRARELARASERMSRHDQFDPMNDSQTPSNSNKPLLTAIGLIMVAVLAWGIFHAIGAYRLNHHLGRPLMVLGCVVAFLGFWAAMLASRRERVRRSKED